MLRTNKSKFRPPVIRSQSNTTDENKNENKLIKTWPLSNKKSTEAFSGEKTEEIHCRQSTYFEKYNIGENMPKKFPLSHNNVDIIDSTTDKFNDSITDKNIYENKENYLIENKGLAKMNPKRKSCSQEKPFLTPSSNMEKKKKYFNLNVDSSSESEISINPRKSIIIKENHTIQDNTLSSSQSDNKNQISSDSEFSTSKTNETTSKLMKKRKLSRDEIFSQSMGSPLSQPDETMSKLERLEWYQSRRNVGIWVVCDACDKMRYLEEVKDPLELPDKWYCWNSTDFARNKCEIPEKGPTPFESLDLIDNQYNAGSIVWARLKGYPWWPAMVDDDPDTEQYYWLVDYPNIPTHYHVTFFDSEQVSRCWLTPNDIKAFKKFTPRLPPRFKSMFSSRISAAIQDAEKAVRLPLLERLKKYSFLARWIEKPEIFSEKKKNNSDDGNSSRQRARKQKSESAFERRLSLNCPSPELFD